MKKAKYIFATGIALITGTLLSAQMYIQVGGGYGFPANKELIAWSYKADANTETYTGEYGTFGKGMDLSLTFGYNLCDNGGVELSYSFLHPLNSQILAATYDDRSDSSIAYTGTDEFGLQMHRIMIGGRFVCGEDNFKPYMRGGIVLGMGGNFSHGDYKYSQTSSTTSQTLIFTEYSGGIALGYYAGLGGTYSFSDMIGLYFEAGFVGQKWAPEKSVITRYEVDGQDMLPNMTTRDKETVYLDELTFTNSAPNDNAPDEDLKSYLPMSTIGLNFGVVIKLGSK